MNFRIWVEAKWAEHVDEVLSWECNLPDYSAEVYFAKYKWWLRREFRSQQ